MLKYGCDEYGFRKEGCDEKLKIIFWKLKE